jgi:hypothetical protein
MSDPVKMDHLELEAARKAIFDSPLPRPEMLAIFATPDEAEQLLRRLVARYKPSAPPSIPPIPFLR